MDYERLKEAMICLETAKEGPDVAIFEKAMEKLRSAFWEVRIYWKLKGQEQRDNGAVVLRSEDRRRFTAGLLYDALRLSTPHLSRSLEPLRYGVETLDVETDALPERMSKLRRDLALAGYSTVRREQT